MHLLEKYGHPGDENVRLEKNQFMNYFGLINSTDILPQGKHLQGQVQTAPPIPDDGVYGSENNVICF